MEKKISILHKIRDFEFPLLIEFFKWKLIDFYRAIKYRKDKKLHLYGIHCITGMYGCGKSVSLSYIANKFRKKYKNQIYICSNYGLSIQDFPFEGEQDLIKNYDKPIIFLWDEVQNDFPSSDREFSKEVLRALTYNRKGNGKRIYWCSQDHELVHKTIRRLTVKTGFVRTISKRFTRIRWYLQEDFLELYQSPQVKKKMKIHPIFTEMFIQTDYIRGLYDSFDTDYQKSMIRTIKKNV